MDQKKANIVVYGCDYPCPSCVHSPSSKETYEWLKAALERKYPNQPFTIEYIDIEKCSHTDSYIESIREGKIFYPAVVINGDLVGEGNPQLKTIFKSMEELGYTPS